MSVIFVDDEPQVLRGIERMLDAAEVSWESEFVNSADEALKLIAKEHFDAIVTEMSLRGMDGAQLLDEVSKRHPDMVRVVLSGKADKETVLRAVSPMHQYLSKPCDAETLKMTLNRACALRDVLHSKSLMETVGSLPSLPSVPKVYQQLVKEIRSETTSLDAVGSILSNDPAMTAKILQLANSAVFGMKEKVSTPAHAAAIVGVETIKSLVLSIGVFQAFEGCRGTGFSIDKLMDHCLAVAEFSKLLATREKLPTDQAHDAFTAGLLHELGKLVLLSADPQKFTQAINMSKEENVLLEQAQQIVFGADYAGVGAYLLSVWGIPQSIVEVVGLHRSPLKAQDIAFSALTAVCAANAIVDFVLHDVPIGELELEYFASIKCDDKLSIWKQTYFESTDQ